MSSAPSFQECDLVHRARAVGRRLAGSLLAVAVVGEAGTGRRTFARELLACRASALAIPACEPLHGAFELDPSVITTLRQGERRCALIDGVEAIDARSQAVLASMVRSKALLPIFVGTRADGGAQHLDGMTSELGATIGAFVELPPLRDRADDIAAWADFFLKTVAQEVPSSPVGFSEDASAAIRGHRWPGNLTELEARIRAAVCRTDESMLTREDLELERPTAALVITPLAEAIESFKRQYVLDALAACGGNRTQAAKALGVDARTVFRYLEKDRT